MKDVLFIMESLDGGGAEKALIEYLKNFDYTRYRVSLCLLFYQGLYLKDIPENVTVIPLYTQNNSFRRKSFRYYRKYHNSWLMSFQIRRKLQRHYDTIISFMEGWPLLFHSFVMKRADRNVTWVHRDLLNYPTSDCFYSSSLERKCYEDVDCIIFVSNTAKENFDKLYLVNTPKKCLYNVVDAKEIKEKAGEENVAGNVFTITSIGSLYKVKGYDRLLRVAKMLKNNGYFLSFQILGCGSELDNLLTLRNELGVEEEVLFLGFEENPYPYLKKSDLFVSTSLSEGLSYVICEAFVLGIPVVATETAGAIELLDNGKYGILTGQDDISIYEGLRKLIDNEELRDEYHLKSLIRAEMFNIDKAMKSVYSLI